MKFGSNKQVSRRTTRESNGGSMSGFSKTGKDGRKKGQFSEKTPGNREVGFTQRTERTATAAMQGRPMGNMATKAKPKNNGSKQFGKAPGKAVF